MPRRRGSNTGIPGLSISWKRALGVSQAQGRLSRKIGIPLSRPGRQRNMGRSMGCSWIMQVVPTAGVLVHLLG